MPIAATDNADSLLAGRAIPVAAPIAIPVPVPVTVPVPDTRPVDLPDGLVRVRVWDLPTRVFHWSLASAIAGLVATGYAGGAWIDWHARIGSLVLALLMFRVLWGFVGGSWSRFAVFVPTPAQLKRYLRGEAGPDAETGHSPLGALSVLAMLVVLLLQAASGMVSDDGAGFTGPLNEYVSSASGLLATALHKDVGQWLLLALVLLHVLAIAYYRIVKRKRLVQAMVGGDKLLPAAAATRSVRDNAGTRALALTLFVGCLLVVNNF